MNWLSFTQEEKRRIICFYLFFSCFFISSWILTQEKKRWIYIVRLFYSYTFWYNRKRDRNILFISFSFIFSFMKKRDRNILFVSFPLVCKDKLEIRIFQFSDNIWPILIIKKNVDRTLLNFWESRSSKLSKIYYQETTHDIPELLLP